MRGDAMEIMAVSALLGLVAGVLAGYYVSSLLVFVLTVATVFLAWYMIYGSTGGRGKLADIGGFMILAPFIICFFLSLLGSHFFAPTPTTSLLSSINWESVWQSVRPYILR